MRYYIAIIEQGDDETSYGVRFPDLPGVHPASDKSLEDAIAQAHAALAFYAEDYEDEDDMPEARSHLEVVNEYCQEWHDMKVYFIAIEYGVSSISFEP